MHDAVYDRGEACQRVAAERVASRGDIRAHDVRCDVEKSGLRTDGQMRRGLRELRHRGQCTRDPDGSVLQRERTRVSLQLQ